MYNISCSRNKNHLHGAEILTKQRPARNWVINENIIGLNYLFGTQKLDQQFTGSPFWTAILAIQLKFNLPCTVKPFWVKHMKNWSNFVEPRDTKTEFCLFWFGPDIAEKMWTDAQFFLAVGAHVSVHIHLKR